MHRSSESIGAIAAALAKAQAELINPEKSLVGFSLGLHHRVSPDDRSVMHRYRVASISRARASAATQLRSTKSVRFFVRTGGCRHQS